MNTRELELARFVISQYLDREGYRMLMSCSGCRKTSIGIGSIADFTEACINHARHNTYGHNAYLKLSVQRLEEYGYYKRYDKHHEISISPVEEKEVS